MGMLSPCENDRRQAGRKIIQWQTVATSVRQIVLGGIVAKNAADL
jgi:hypothetical protein